MFEEDSIKETNSGLRKEGNWSDIARFGEKIQNFLEEEQIGEESLKKFSEWRPKLEESEGDVKRKTVDEAVMNETESEKETEGAKEDLKNASDKIADAGKKAAKIETPEKEIIEASEQAARPFYSRIISFLRTLESLVYSWFALRFNPYYLDTEKFSVDVKELGNGEFQMFIAFQEKEIREKMISRIKGGS